MGREQDDSKEGRGGGREQKGKKSQGRGQQCSDCGGQGVRGLNGNGKIQQNLKKLKLKKTRISVALSLRKYFYHRGGYNANSRLRHLNTLFKCPVLQNCKNITARWKIVFYHPLICQIPLSYLQHSKRILTDQQK